MNKEKYRPMSHTSRTHTPRRSHRQPICEQTGRRRYRDGKDARLALRDAARIRSAAAIAGGDCAWIVTRSYKCEDGCHGWHLSGRPAKPAELAIAESRRRTFVSAA
jgi:hypothetical protein